MIDLDMVDVGSKLEITANENEKPKASAQFIQALHRCDKGWAILLRASDEEAGGSGQVVDIAIDRKAAKMIINYLQTIYEL